MTSTAAGIAGILSGAHDQILDEATDALGRSHLRHYDTIDLAQRRARLERLFEVTVDCLQSRQLTPVVGYAEQIARERFDNGFDIGEVQTAFNVLEEAMWRTLADATPPSEIVAALGLLTTVLGVGKDAFARSYVSLASKQHVPSLDLRAMFEGTGG